MTVKDSDQVTLNTKILREEVYIDNRFFDELYEHIKNELAVYGIEANNMNVFAGNEGIVYNLMYKNNSQIYGNTLSYFLQHHIWNAFKSAVHYYHYNVNKIPHYSNLSFNNVCINVTIMSGDSCLIML